MQKESKARLDHLARILRGLSINEAGFILSDMASDHYFESDVLEYLGSKIFYPESILNELSVEHLSIYYKNLETEVCAFLYQNYPELVPSLSKFVPGIQKKKNEKYTEDQVLTILQKTLSKLVSEGKIAYNGKSLLFFPPDCKNKDKLASSKIILEVMNPVLAAGTPVRILIQAPKYAGRYVRISFQQLGHRFFSEDNWFAGYQLDEKGMFDGELLPRHTDGPCSLWVEIPGEGEAHRTIYFSSSTDAIFSAHLHSLKKEDKYFKLDLELIHKREGILKDKSFIRIYCERCGAPLHFCVGVYEKPTYRFSIPEKVFSSGHSERVLIYIQNGDNTALKIINIKDISNTNVLFQIMPAQEISDTLEIDEPNFLEKGEYYLCLYSSDKKTLLEHIRYFLSQPELLEKASKDNFQRSPSPLEMSINGGEIILLEERREKVFQQYVYAFDSDFQTSLHLQGFSRVEPVFMVLLRKEKDWHIYKGMEFPRLDENLVSPELPDSLYKGEETEISIYYKVKNKINLKIHAPRPTDLSLEGKGIARCYLRFGETLEIEWQKKEQESVRKTWKPKEREWSFTEIILKQDTDSSENQMNVEDMILFLGQMYLEYKWICGEQVAARIVGLCYMLSLLEKGKSRTGILGRIQTALNTLESYRNDNGFYGIFSKETGDEKTTRVIYSHLKLCLVHEVELKKEIPRLFEIISSIKKILNDAMPEKVKGDFLFESMKDEGNLLENAHLYLERKDSRLNVYRSVEMFSNNAVFTILLGLMHLYPQMKLVVSKKRKVKEEVSHRSGFLGVLEKLNLLSPQVSKKIENKVEKIADGKSCLMENTVFRYVENSYLSTIELTSIWKLCLAYLEAEKKQKGSNLLSFQMKINPLLPQSKTSSFLKLGRYNLDKGEYFELEIDRKKLLDKIVKIYYPYIVDPVLESNFFHENGELSLYPRFNQKTKFSWKASRKGKGLFFAILENPYNPSEFELITMGEIKIS